MLKPKTTEEISKILSFCNINRLAVCPQGGNTSVVGGSVPVLDEVIISTSLMNEIVSLDETAGKFTSFFKERLLFLQKYTYRNTGLSSRLRSGNFG